MDVKDQLGAMRARVINREAFTRSLLAASEGNTTMPLATRRALASAYGQAKLFAWSGYDTPELFVPNQDNNGTLPNFSIVGSSKITLSDSASEKDAAQTEGKLQNAAFLCPCSHNYVKLDGLDAPVAVSAQNRVDSTFAEGEGKAVWLTWRDEAAVVLRPS